MSTIPADLRYTKSHEWVRLEGDIVTVGITEFAQSELGDVVFVELPQVGRSLATDESFGTVESVKTVSELYAPVSGVVVESNGALATQSELVNTAPYDTGFMVKLRVSDPSELSQLLTADDYAKLVH